MPTVLQAGIWEAIIECVMAACVSSPASLLVETGGMY